MSPLRLTGSTSGYSQLDAPAVAGDQTFTLPGTGGTLDRLNRAGNVLQVVSATKTDTFSSASTSFTDITGLSASITPTSASNKILIMIAVTGTGTDVANASDTGYRLMRDSTAIAVSSTGTYKYTGQLSNRNLGGTLHALNHAITHLDSPATTSSVTYKAQCAVGGGTFYLNQDVNGSTFSVSSITLLEVAA